ncbi:hypothetical protein CI109_107294 [Kwoniella shandongensis]|uniref:Myotubularin phosphatase domain-containing protein n=1 Tax=Kwoniella shandongensis TaxID=1734106 RepID=A0A5M6C281_9TREE|nr:uncharacterized protein CI109_002578 [Kwoniella shandongensis]KAA5529236.1 hypothetical protein CI109_002578 [Kwoniella shandongensis]
MDSLRVTKVDDVVLEYFVPPSSPEDRPYRQRRTGTLHLTSHHLIFSQTASSNASEPEVWVPYPAITLLTRLPQSIHGLYPIQVETRTFDSYVLLFEKDRDGGAEDVWQSVKDSAVKNSVEQLHAFFYTSTVSGSGWSTFNPRNEFARQGLGTRTKAWRFTDLNKDYTFSPTYPSKLVIPSRISDSTLAYAAKYRSKARIPALTYLHWANNASITRSSQPMVGLKNSRSAQDERLVECIFSSHLFPEVAYASVPAPIFGATSTNLIIDARPTTNAMANVAMGAGTENMENYKLGKKAYLGIDNIHVMRNSLKMIIEALRDADSKPSGVIDRGLLRKSNWLRHISTILDGALIIIRNVHLNASHVLIHCSDGWDRTAQLSAVAQIALDPYYRTLDGFKILIEKDWLAFGHKFLDRSGHLSSEKLFMVTENDEDSDEETGGGGAQRAAQAFFASVQKQFASTSHVKEVSPVFHQFLDCVRQIQRQSPNRFEFNEQYLLDIYYHLYSCQFGTFLFNNERDRQTPHSGKPYIERTASLWDYLNVPSQRAKHVNPDYDPSLDDKESRALQSDQGVLLFDPKDVKFWNRLFHRGDEEMNGSSITLAQAQGAEVIGPLGAGQEDPVSIEGVVRAQPPLRANLPESSSRPRSWAWSSLSNNAFNAVQSAAREIKNISTDAIAQLKAEAGEIDGEMWRKGESDGPSTNRALPAPSDTNPWSLEPRKSTAPSISRVDSTTPKPLNGPVGTGPSHKVTSPANASTSNPWATTRQDSLPILSTLSINTKANPLPPDDATVRAAMGEDQKAWDPLGAL